MKKVLAILAIVFAVAFVVSFDCPRAIASIGDEGGSPPVAGIQTPDGDHHVSGVCGGGSSEGDPDDLGGGFRGTNGLPKPLVDELTPTLNTVAKLVHAAQLFWMTILH
jgi:hypothetical protein